MDVNGTRFHLVLGPDDWGRWSLSSTAGYDKNRDEVSLLAQPFLAPVLSGSTPVEQTARRGAARDRFGNWYAVEIDTTVLAVTSPASGTSRFWPVSDRPPPGAGAVPPNPDFSPVAPASTPAQPMGAVAVTDDHYLVVGVLDPAGLLVFDLRAGGPPDRFEWPAQVPFHPVDTVARPGGGVFVLDPDERLLWELDRTMRVLTRTPHTEPAPQFTPDGVADPGPDPGSGPRSVDRPLRIDAWPIEDGGPAPGAAPVALDVTADGTVVVLFGPATPGEPSSVRAFRDGAPVAAAVVLPGPPGTSPIVGHDLALLPVDGTPGPGQLARLFVLERHADQVLEYLATLTDGSLTLTLKPSYYPLGLAGGRALVAGAGQVWTDQAAHWLPVVEQPRRRYSVDAELTSPHRSLDGVQDLSLDGGEDGCVWHRLMLDAVLPPETSIEVYAAAADDLDELALPSWRRQPRPYQRGDGSELPFSTDPGYRTYELAFQEIRGHHLRLRLRLSGNGRATPRLRALRAYYPRFSYLEQYLPAVYRDDPASASFLDRFLANFEGIATTIEGRIAAAELLFDPRTAPADALPWLASWFELVLDPTWDEARRRLLLANTSRLFAWRGTVRGLQTALALALEREVDPSLFDDHPSHCAQRTRIVELYQTKLSPGVLFGDPSDPMPSAGAGVARWRPDDGADALHHRWAAATGATDDPAVRYPVEPPSSPGARSAWVSFSRAALGFVPLTGERERWQGFLARRYRRPAALAAAYELLTPVPFELIEPAVELPRTRAALVDWYQFQSVTIRGVQTAHRFRVLLPVSAGTRTDTVESGQSRAFDLTRARRLVELEKPAHTVFDVGFYWDAFRVGEARLGLDSLVDLGSRSPLLLGPVVLGSAHLGENVLDAPAAEGRLAVDDRGCR